jgi:hypothetical protein
MSIRSVLLAACLTTMLAPLPALAGERDARHDDARHQDGRLGEIGAKLSDPRSQIAVTTMLAALSEAVLDMKVDSMVRAMRSVDPDAAGDLPDDARVRDLAGPGADHLSGDIGRTVPRAMGAAAGMADAMGDMLPQLRAMGERMRQAVPRD